MKHQLSISLFFSLLSLSSMAMGIFGSYTVTGQAYNSKGELIRNGEIVVDTEGRTETIKTDSAGVYRFDVGYGTACPSVVRGFARLHATNKMNPKFITLHFGDEAVRVKNKWRKYSSKEIRMLDIRFG